MSNINKLLIFIAIMASSLSFAKAQSNHTTSPYSRYGYGVLSDKGIGASRGMGGISYGIRNQYLNPGNPASYAGVDSTTFIFDMGISYSKANLSQPGASQNDDNGGLEHLGMQFKLAKRLGFSVGFLPYSSVGYSFGKELSSGDIEKDKAQAVFQGSGSWNQIYGGLAYEPINGISIGANISYIYGRLYYVEYLQFPNDPTQYTSNAETRLSINGVKFDIGLQYQIPLQNRSKILTLGAVYTPPVKPSARLNYSLRESTGDTIGTSVSSQGVRVKFPHTFGFGFTLASRKLLFGADVTYQKWKDLEYPELMQDGMSSSDRFNNRWRVNAGAEFSINPNDRNFFKRIKFRGGINYSNSYINVKTEDGRIGGYKEYGASVGLGLPLRDFYTGRTTYINLAFEYTRLNPEFKNSMVKEEYFNFTLGINLNDLWFMKNKFK